MSIFGYSVHGDTLSVTGVRSHRSTDHGSIFTEYYLDPVQ